MKAFCMPSVKLFQHNSVGNPVSVMESQWRKCPSSLLDYQGRAREVHRTRDTSDWLHMKQGTQKNKGHIETKKQYHRAYNWLWWDLNPWRIHLPSQPEFQHSLCACASLKVVGYRSKRLVWHGVHGPNFPCLAVAIKYLIACFERCLLTWCGHTTMLSTADDEWASTKQTRKMVVCVWIYCNDLCVWSKP